MKTWLGRHLQVMFSTLGDMRRTPMTSINTIAIVAVALLLPSFLYIAVKSGQSLSSNWQGRPQISIFLQQATSPQVANLIFEEVRLHPSVQLAELLSPQQALEEFRILSGLSSELEFLDENPLPHSIVIMPNAANSSEAELLQLQDQLGKIEGIESIRLDLDWTNRFNAILRVFTQVSILLSALLAAGLVLIVGNTIKLLVLNRRQEIEITKLVGGTDSFVRRPFLYYGGMFGLFGAVVSLLLLWLSARLLQPPLAELASLYQRETLLHQPDAAEIGGLLLLGLLLGWVAARWSVARHLHQIQPR